MGTELRIWTILDSIFRMDGCRMSPCKFHDWITSKRLEILGWNFVWWLILMIYSWNEPIEKIGPPQPPQPPQPPYPPTNHMQLANFHNFCPIWMKLGMEVPFKGIRIKWADGGAGPISRPPKNHPDRKLWSNFDENICIKWANCLAGPIFRPLQAPYLPTRKPPW